VNLLVAGSIALDSLEGPFGSVTGELGGSALYFALAASLIRPVQVVAPVGRETLEAVKRSIGDRPIDIARVSVLDVPTYRWTARQESGGNLDLGSLDGIYDLWEPDLAEGLEGWAFVGSMRPDRQLQAAQALRDSAELLAGDSMRSYVGSHRSEAERVLGACGWFCANREELVALGATRMNRSGSAGPGAWMGWSRRPAPTAARCGPTPARPTCAHCRATRWWT
jgi:hypothetical protein